MSFPTFDALRNFRLISQIHDVNTTFLADFHIRVAQEVIVHVLFVWLMILQQRGLWLLQYDVLFLGVGAFGIILIVHIAS